MRPRSLEEFVGQEHILAPGKLLRRAIEADRLPSVIFYGPPGSGKTTLARVIAEMTHAKFVRISGVESNVAEMRRPRRACIILIPALRSGACVAAICRTGDKTAPCILSPGARQTPCHASGSING